MSKLSPAGQQLVQDLSNRHGVSQDAALHMLIAVSNGNGSMAQFNHSEFGGGGQWMSGGMTMVSDLFNNQLKSRVDSICCDISNALANHQSGPFVGSFQSQSQSGSSNQSQAAGGIGGTNALFEPDPEQLWWPQNLGSPAAVGSQNNCKYAYFPNIQRLAVSTSGSVWVYDTGNHQIGGFGQQQGSGGSITFTSQFGTVNLNQLRVVIRNGQTVNDAPKQNPPANTGSTQFNAPSNFNNAPAPALDGMNSTASANVIATIERLGTLLQQGIVTQQEFETKKAELLQRL